MKSHTFVITNLLIFVDAVSYVTSVPVFSNGTDQYAGDISQIQDFRNPRCKQQQTKAADCETLLIFDLSKKVTQENIFNITIKTFLQLTLKNCKSIKYISIDNNFNNCENPNLCNVETNECDDFNGCEQIIKNLNYNITLSSYSANLIQDDSATIKKYFTFLNKTLSLIAHCESNSVLLLTNRIVPLNNVSGINVNNLFEKMTILLLGRSDPNATGFLQNAYKNITVAKTLNLPNYDCLNYLFYCLLSCSNNTPECLKSDIDDCQQRSTLMPNDKLNETMHIWCIFAITNTTNFDQSSVFSVVSRLQQGIVSFTKATGIIQYRIKVFFDENGYFTEDVITLPDSVPSKEGYQYIDISTDDNNATTDKNQFNDRLSLIPWSDTLTERRLGIWYIFVATNYATDDFKAVSNEKHLWGQMNIYKDFEAYNTYHKILQSDTYIHLSYQAIESAVINVIPLNYNETGSTTTTTIKSSISLTSTKLFKTSPSSITTSNKKSIILIICGSIVGFIIIIVAIIVAILFIFYRIKLRKAFAKRMQMHHDQQNSDCWELTWNRLVIKNDELSTGANEQLLHGTLLSDFRDGAYQSSFEIAIKMPNKHALQIDKDRFLKEINMMKQISGHDNIIKIFGSITKESPICLIMEFCSNLDLLNYVREIKYDENKFEEYKKQRRNEFFVFAWQILHGMQYLSSKLIIHRNICAKNVLINREKNAKLTDFGLAIYENDKMEMLSIHDKNKLYTRWLAIEVLKNYEFSFQSDIWAYGVTLYEMYSFGETPYADVEANALLEYFKTGKRLLKPDFCPDKIFETMVQCWNEIPAERLTNNEVITNFTELMEQLTEEHGYLKLKSAIGRNNSE